MGNKKGAFAPFKLLSIKKNLTYLSNNIFFELT